MFAIYQSGYNVYGVGETLTLAKDEARRWIDPAIDGADWEERLAVVGIDSARGETHGQLYARPCTVRLAQEVQQHGGDCLYEVNAAGELDLPEAD